MKLAKTPRNKDLVLAVTLLEESFPELTPQLLIKALKCSEGEEGAKARRGRLLTYNEVANLWSCSKRHVQYLCEKGELTTVKIGPRAIRIPEVELLKMAGGWS